MCAHDDFVRCQRDGIGTISLDTAFASGFYHVIMLLYRVSGKNNPFNARALV